MRHQAYRRLALMLSVLFVVAVPAQASPVGFQDVVALANVLGQSGRPSVELRLRSFAQQQQSKPSAQQPAPAGNNGEQKGAPAPDGSAAPAKSLTGTEVQQTGQQTNVETIELGEINGTLCDCGDLVFPGGGFARWPLLALGAVPFFFLEGGDKNPPDFPPDTPTEVIPEPATIFLFGSGLVALGASARRARAGRRSKVEGARGEA